MADLFSILSNAASSLGAQRGAAATITNNIMNATTPGYSRQIAEITSMVPGERVGNSYIGLGATLGAVTQSRDRFLEAQLPGAFSNASSSQARADALSAVGSLDPQAVGGLASSLAAFYSSLRLLAQNPGDAGLRQSTVASAQSLTTAFARAGDELTQTRNGIDSQVSALTSNVNQLASQVAQLNGQIVAASASGGQPNDLLDARQKAVDQLAQVAGIKIVPDSAGNANLSFADGTALVSGARAATVVAQPVSTNDSHVGLVVRRADGSQAGVAKAGGQLGGLIIARDGPVAQAQASIDQLAFDIASAVNLVHAAGFAQDGSTGRPLFVIGATAAGTAAGISVDAAITGNPSLLAAAASSTGASGDATNMQAMIDTESARLSSGSDAAGTASSITSAFGAAVASAAADATHDSGLRDHLTALRESVSGVSIDQETISLQQSQRAYEAILKVISTSDQMLAYMISALTGVTG